MFLDGAICAEAEAVLVARDIDARGVPAADDAGAGRVRGRARRCLTTCSSRSRSGRPTLPNRIVSTSHQTSLVRDHLPTEATSSPTTRNGRVAVSGFIVLEATAVHESGLLHAHTLAGYRDGIADGYRRIAAAVQRHGTRLAVQLFHGGREQIASAPRPPALAPSAIPSQRFGTEPRALSDAEVDELIGGYAACGRAGRSRRPRRRRDLGRPQLPGRAVLHAGAERARRSLARRPCVPARGRRRGTRSGPGARLGVRLSADAPAAVGVAGALGGRVDYLSLALGESSTYRGSVGIVPPPPFPENAVAELTGPFRGGPPVIATTRVVDPVAADRLIARGPRRRGRNDPGADHRSRASAQVARGPAARRPSLHRLQRVHRPLPRRHADRLRPESAHRTRAEPAAGEAGRRGRADRRRRRRAGGACRRGGAARLRGRRPRARALGQDRRPDSLSPAPPPATPTRRARSCENYERLLDAVEVRLGVAADAAAVAALRPGGGRRRDGRPPVRAAHGLDGTRGSGLERAGGRDPRRDGSGRRGLGRRREPGWPPPRCSRRPAGT